MLISVILCTYDRCLYLRKVLDSIAGSVLPDSVEWEVLVVDNNSTDQTSEVANEFAGRYPGRFRYISEPRQGKSYALNTGIRESRGNVLAFVDDDLTVEPTWLRNLTQALDDGKWAGAGGRTLLAEPFSPPRWLALKGPYSMGGVLAAQFDLGEEACELDRPPFGANMAFQKKMFEKYGGFRTDLGPSPNPGIPRPNEDTEFGRRLVAAGQRLRYEPSAVAYHPVPKQRIEKQYFLTWWFDYGRAAILEVGRRPDIWGIPRRYFTIGKTSATLAARALRWMATLDPQRRFFLKCRVWATAGQIVEVNRQWRDLEGAKDQAARETEGQCNARP